MPRGLELEESALRDDQKGAAHLPNSTFVDMFLILKTIIGLGTVAIPVAIVSFGAVPGILLLMLAAVLSCTGGRLYILSCKRFGRCSSPSILANATYPWMGTLVDMVFAIKAIGVCGAYHLGIAKGMASMYRGFGYTHAIFSSEATWGILALIIIAPLTFIKRIHGLKYVSLLGLLIVLYLLLVSVGDVLSNGVVIPDGFSAFSPIKFTTLGRLGILIFSTTFHQNVFQLHNETRNNSVGRLSAICSACVAISLPIYILYGFLSILGNNGIQIEESMLSYYPPDIYHEILRGSFSLFLALSYPLQAMSYRASASRIFCRKATTMFQHVLFTCFILGFTTTVTFCELNISRYLGLVGSTTSPFICHIFPSVVYLKLHESGATLAMARFLLTSGVLIFFICTASSIASFF